MKKFKALLFAALLLLNASLAQADYQSAAKAYEEKDYAKAFGEFRELAELGHPNSQLILGAMYYNGEGVSKNLLLAYAWVRLAADAGDKKATQLESQIRAAIDEEGIERARALLQNFTPEAIDSRLLPKIIDNCEYQNATPPVPIRRKPPAYPRDLIANRIQGSVLFELLIAVDGTVRDVRIIDAIPRGVFDEVVVASVLKWKLKPAKRNGKPFATWAESQVVFNLTNTYVGEGLTAYMEKIKTQAADGNPTAQYTYGLILAGYPLYQKPWSEVLPWMMKAAQGGLAVAQYRVAHSLLRGRGCVPDDVKATEWLLRAAQQDYSDAQIELAKLALTVGPGYDATKGMFWLERAATNSDIKGKKYLASILAASPNEALRDAKRALVLIDEVLKIEKRDITAQEIRAAALAQSGDFSSAAALQAEAIIQAEKRDWDLTELNERLHRYQAGQTWHGDLILF